jgi:hypothetical protein
VAAPATRQSKTKKRINRLERVRIEMMIAQSGRGGKSEIQKDRKLEYRKSEERHGREDFTRAQPLMDANARE